MVIAAAACGPAPAHDRRAASTMPVAATDAPTDDAARDWEQQHAESNVGLVPFAIGMMLLDARSAPPPAAAPATTSSTPQPVPTPRATVRPTRHCATHQPVLPVLGGCLAGARESGVNVRASAPRRP
jgi:hypothetical protein